MQASCHCRKSPGHAQSSGSPRCLLLSYEGAYEESQRQFANAIHAPGLSIFILMCIYLCSHLTLLQDLIELRDRKWVTRTAVAAPSTIAQIHEAVSLFVIVWLRLHLTSVSGCERQSCSGEGVVSTPNEHVPRRFKAWW